MSGKARELVALLAKVSLQLDPVLVNEDAPQDTGSCVYWELGVLAAQQELIAR